MPGRIITAYRVDNGARVDIPEHWLGHPTLGEQFTAEPPAAEESADEAPQDTTSRPAGGRKAPKRGADEPPATGDEKE